MYSFSGIIAMHVEGAQKYPGFVRVAKLTLNGMRVFDVRDCVCAPAVR